MCNVHCVVFGARTLPPDEVRGKRVIEVGSLNVNGSLRPILECWEPREYVGADVVAGPGVDVVCRAEELTNRFGPDTFDVVVSTEMLEHVRDWRVVVSNLKRVCRPGGLLVITTRRRGFPYHAHPCDFWRYEPDDLRAIFSDCEILRLEAEPREHGVHLKARKPAGFVEKNLAGYALWSIVVGHRVEAVRDEDLWTFRYLSCVMREKLAWWLSRGQSLVLDLYRAVFGV